jgi:hypothetical protein
MKTKIKPTRSKAPDQVTDTHDRNDLTRRNGSIRGVMLNVRISAPDRVLGLAKQTKDISI